MFTPTPLEFSEDAFAVGRRKKKGERRSISVSRLASLWAPWLVQMKTWRSLKIGQKEEVINREEDKMVRFQMLRFETPDTDSRRCDYYEGLVEHHSAKVMGHLQDLKKLKRRLRRHRQARAGSDATGAESEDESVVIINE